MRREMWWVLYIGIGELRAGEGAGKQAPRERG